MKYLVTITACALLICVLMTGCLTSGPTDATDSIQKNSWEVSEEVKLQLKQDYVEYMSFSGHSCTADDVKLVVISHVDPGYAVVISCKCGSVNLNASWENLMGDSAGDLQFYMPNGWFLQFCKDGKFNTLSAAYNAGWLNYKQLCTVWNDYHAQFPKALETWQDINAGQTEPPERDSCGLDYGVNEDGVTCKITGLGVYNDVDVVIPEYIDGYRVTEIGYMAFLGSGIKSVTMPNSVVRIGRSAFEKCHELKRITLSASLESVGIWAFARCDALESITLPDSLTLIDGGAFRECTSLTNLTIPAGITDIGEEAFSYCPKLVAIEYNGTVAQWEAINKSDPWSEGAGKCTIICTDGEIVEGEA